MTDWLAPLLATLVPVLGRALLHFVWQGALIGLLAAIALQWLRDARPQVRYAVACVAMLACVLVPAIDVLLQLRGTAPAVAVLADSRIVAGLALPRVDVATWPVGAAGRRVPEGMFPLIVALWAAGASVLSLRMGLGVAWIRRLQATPQGPAHAVWQARLDALADRFGLAQPIALRLVETLDSPASAGWWRPVVLLPSALVTRMPVELIEALLAHELAHIRRHDYLVNLLQGVVEALLFYHPVTWWLSRRIRREREHIADQLAAEVTGAPHRLALALSELSDLRAHPQPHHPQPDDALPHLAQAALATHGGHLMSRIQHLIQPGQRTTGGKLVFPLLGLAAACFALYAQAQVATPQPAPAPAAVPAPVIVERDVTKPAPVIVKRVVTLPAPANTPVPPGQTVVTEVRRLKSDDAQNAFALVRRGDSGYSMSGSSDDMDAVKAARTRIDGDFLWFRRGDQAYVVVDPATVARAQAAWGKADELGPRMGALGKEMEVHGKKLEGLGTRMEKLTVIHRPSPEMEAAADRMKPLADQMQKLAGEQARLALARTRASDGQQDDALDARMEALSAQMEAVTGQMRPHIAILEAHSGRIEADAKPIEELSRQMEAASKPMEVLGVKMEVLGKQHQQHVKAAEQELQTVISAAVAQGLAKPAPAAAGKP